MTGTPDDNWPDLGAELRQALAAGLDVAGTVDETDVLARVGATTEEFVMEVSDLEGVEQAGAYSVMCDLLASRIDQGTDQVLGCLIFSTRPDAEALVTGLTGMLRPDGVFTPVIPLGAEQAAALAGGGVAIDDLIDDATSLIGIAADRDPVTTGVAGTLLGELDELVDRRTPSSP